MKTQTSTPTSTGCWNPVTRALAALAALVYLFMPNLGIVELLPDNLPFVGNLDELAATFILVNALSLAPWVDSPSKLRWLMLGGIALISGLYLLNPTAGFIEFIPDNLPIVGNIDEMIAAYGLTAVWAQLYYPRIAEARAQAQAPVA
ncbi:MAG: hypothetical protein SNJ54_08540 [Anaerolineae bacterium]